MVTAVAQWGRSGTSNWLAQRISALIILAYILCLCGFFFTHPDLTYAQWKDYFAGTAMRVFSVAVLLSVAVHAWIGLWSVATDYLTERLMGRKGNVLRILFLGLTIAVLFTFVVWGIQVIWS